MQRNGERIEEALLEVDALDEVTLLKYLAALYKTRFVSTEKLAKADIDRHHAREGAEEARRARRGLPGALGSRRPTCSAWSLPDPDNAPALHDVQLASGAKEVRAFVGRPRAVRAAINKAYNGDIHAFAVLDRAAHQQFSTMLDIYERNLVSEESMAVSLASEGEQRERMLSEAELEEGRLCRRHRACRAAAAASRSSKRSTCW